jgi:hypothetical protein
MSTNDQCLWKPWYKAHNRYEKLPDTYDIAGYIALHNVLVGEQAAELVAAGYRVTVEEQNDFKLRGSTGAVFAGKPDLIATVGEEVLVVDCKTGAQQPWHNLQVMIYMLCLPHARRGLSAKQIVGRVQYPDSAVEIPADRLDDTFRAEFKRVMGVIGGSDSPRQVPSPLECRFCNIGPAYCGLRVETPPDEIMPADDLF